MPSHNCKHPTCAVILPQRGYCAAHAHLAPPSPEQEKQRRYDQTNRDPRSKAFYDSAAWQRARAAQLAHHPLCQRDGCRKLAEQVHHIRPVKEVRDTEPRLLFAGENLLSVCAQCHVQLEAEARRCAG